MLDSDSSDQMNEKVQKVRQGLNSLTKEFDIVHNSLQKKLLVKMIKGSIKFIKV